MTKLKIGLISHIKYPIQEPFVGGLESFTHTLAKGLIARGHDVTVFASSESDPQINVQAISPPTALDINEYYRPTYSINEYEIIPCIEYQAYSKLMLELRNAEFDVLHNNSLHHIVNTFSDILPMPVVTTLHTPPFEWLAKSFEHPTKNNFCITISKYMHDIWSPIINNSIIMNGVDLSKFKYNPNTTKENYAIWFGRITPEKGTIYAIKAAKQLGIKLKLIGAVYDQNYFHNEIEPELNDDIQYLGHLSQNDLNSYLNSANLSICTPCWEEPYGLVAIESLASGTPVAAFNRGAIKEILNEKSGALAEPDDVDSLSIAIKEAAQLNSTDCRNRAEEIASLDKMIFKYEAAYQNATTKSKKL